TATPPASTLSLHDALPIFVLTPLTVFEVTSLLPAAAVQLVRSRYAARRVLELLDATSPAMSPPPTGQEPVPGPPPPAARLVARRSEEHTSELQSRENLVCR